MNKLNHLKSGLTGSLLSLVSLAANGQDNRPNIVLIMTDDMGYECLSCNGSLSYQTPNLDRLANQGIRFTNCISQPLSTPSRLKMMTGKYNYRNYEYFGYMNPNQKTFGNYLKEAGYSTCIAGKWQLNGITQNLPGNQNTDRPYHFGFDEYCLWQLNRHPKYGERFADPLITQNGKELEGLEDSYGPDIFCNFVCDFIEKNSGRPFFVYYPMVLVHDPFVPTPDSPEWTDPSRRYERNNDHFKDMVEYSDKIVGEIETRLKEKGVLENTIFIFTGDNGTNLNIITETTEGNIKGGKSFTTNAGCHVPLIVSWPEFMQEGRLYESLISFSDFFPTLLEAAGVSGLAGDIDGKSFFSVLKGGSRSTRETVLVHYDPQWHRTSLNRNRFAQTLNYKLYREKRFFNISIDPLELYPIENLTKEEDLVRTELQKVLNKAEQESPWIESR